MININLQFQKKDLWLLSAIVVFLVGVGYVIAVNGNGLEQWQIHGHDATEIGNLPINFIPTDISTMNWGDDSSGSVELPNGLIMKWGKITSVNDGDTAVTFANQGVGAFPSNCFQVIVSGGFGLEGPFGYAIRAHTISKTGFTITVEHPAAEPVRWFAIGY